MNLKDKKGSISIFVLVALLFMSAFLIISFGANVNKSKVVKEQFNIISQTYSYTNEEEGAYDKAYTDLRKKNKQTMIASSETSNLELTKTYADKMSNLRIYGNSVQKRLPDNYQEIEYIQCNAASYIDTNVKLTSEIRAVYNYSFTGSTNAYKFPLGVWGENYHFAAGVSNSDYFAYRYSTSGLEISTKKAIINTKYKIDISKNGFYVDDELISEVTTTIGSNNNNIFVGALNADGTPNISYSAGQPRIYDLIIYDGDNIIRNMIPCYRKKDNKTGMYDLIEKKFYSNLSDTEFTKGPNFAREITPTTPAEVQGVGNLVTDTTDENYGKYRIPVKVSGKNLIDINKANLNEYVVAGEIGAEAKFSSKSGCISFAIECKPNTTYTLSSKTLLRRRISEVDNLGSNIILKDTITTSGGELPYTFTTTADTNAILICLQVGTNPSVAITQEEVEAACIQLEEGTTVTEYENNKGQTFNIVLDEPLRKLGEYSDYIDFKTGKVVRNIGYTVLTGKTWWSTYDNSQDNVLGFFTSSLPSRSSVSKGNSLSNRFVRTNTDIAPEAILGVDYETFFINDRYFKISVSKTRVSDLDTFKTWLDKNPTYIYFVLETPTEEDISLPELSTYEDYTKIEVLTDVATSKIEAEYIGYTLD